jgi:hypothetical protein
VNRGPAAPVALLNAECVAWSSPILDFGFAILDYQRQKQFPRSDAREHRNPKSKI